MKNYELVLMFSVGEDTLTNQTIDKYKSVITDNNGVIDRYEDWGSLKMSYDINNENKARYILINFKADNKIIDQLNELIKFNAIPNPATASIERIIPFIIGSSLPKGPSLIPKKSIWRNTASIKCNMKFSSI